MENVKKYRLMLIKRLFLSLLVALALIASSPVPAHADSWLEFFFPSLKKEKPDPSLTGMAEFADENQVITAPTVEEGLPENSTPLHIRHRPSADIAKWVENILPDLMSYEADRYKEQYKTKVLLFNPTAKAAYLKFLKESNFIKTLETGRYDINAFVEEIPMIMNEGDVEGRYRWLYKTRVMVTYVSKGATDYKLVKDGETVTQTMHVTVQVGRAKPSELPQLPEGMDNQHGLMIESFDVKVIKPKTTE
jgi:hypothetical protein